MNMSLKREKPIAVVKTFAASGNLGPGYDVLGLALDIFNTHSVFYSNDKRYHIEFRGSQKPDISTGEDNLIIKVIKRVLKKSISAYTTREKNIKVEKPLKIIADINIPMKKGLSSSSSAIVAGLLIADKVYDLRLGKDELFNTGMEFENHPDGIAASLYGGLVATYKEEEEYKVKKIPLKYDYKLVLFIPESEIETNKARELIPKKVSMDDCIYNISNTLLLVESLKSNDLNMARLFIKDKLHQPYRKEIYERSFNLVNLLINDFNIPAAISGAGPSVIAILNNKTANNLKKFMSNIKKNAPGFKIKLTRICYKGSYTL